jgi:pyruvate formate lyase activating enzyme
LDAEGQCAHCGQRIAGVFEDRPVDWGPRRMPVSMHEAVESGAGNSD